MEFSRLGQTQTKISRMGFGCGPASDYDYGLLDKSEWRDGVHAALDHGVNFFDVADVYGFGSAEQMLADALGDRRREVVIATKCGLAWNSSGKVRRDLRPPSIVEALEGSLRRLRLDCIPLYQIHWPDPSVPIEQAMETLCRCQEAGKIRFIGVGNLSLNLLERAYAVGHFESQQMAFNLLCREAERSVFPWCRANGMTNIAHSGLARGFLAGRRPLGGDFCPRDTRGNSPYFSGIGQFEKQQLLNSIRKLQEETGKSVASIAIRWMLDDPLVDCVLVGIKTRRQMQENLEAMGWRLMPETRSHLSALSDACPEGLAGVPAHAHP
jgi:aryl-alcohol dehydrogenase-like predicted oxidoreductase